MINFVDMKNLLKQSISSQDDQLQMQQLEEDLNRNDHNEQEGENDQHIIYIRDENESPPFPQESLAANGSTSNEINQTLRNQNINVEAINTQLRSELRFPRTNILSSLREVVSITSSQQTNQIVSERNTELSYQTNKDSLKGLGIQLLVLKKQISECSHIVNHHYSTNYRLFIQQSPQFIELLQMISIGLSNIKLRLSNHMYSEYVACLIELEGGFWKLLSTKLKMHQTFSITQFFFQTFFLMISVYFSLKQFDYHEEGSKLVLMYVIKNALNLFITNKEMNSVIKRVEEKENLQSNLIKSRDKFQELSDSINSSEKDFNKLLDWHLQITNEIELSSQEIETLLKQSIREAKTRIEIVDRILEFYSLNLEEIEISTQKQSLGQFKRRFHPVDEFELLPRKKSMNLVKQAILKDTPGMFVLSYFATIMTYMMTILTCVVLFSKAEFMNDSYLTVLWLNIVRDNLTNIVTLILIFLYITINVILFTCYWTKTIWRRVRAKIKIAQQLNSLKEQNFTQNCEVKECIICLSDYEEGQKLITLNCDPKHNFHKKCILTWMNMSNECPFCRASVFPN